MCGICGVIESNGNGQAAALVHRMTPTMFHRGPDDEGYFVDGPFAFGMRRLSIIDLEHGHQPVFNEDRLVAVVLNGEIYNYRELRNQLWDRGHSFSTRSDSEVVAHAYEEWGDECVHHFEGMFALAVYDRRPRERTRQGPTLFLARDPLGIKPLYYAHVSSCEFRVSGSENGAVSVNTKLETRDSKPVFLFASEVRTLLASDVVTPLLSHTALRSYLLFGSVSEPQTLVEGVFSLPPGHRMTIQLDAPRTAATPECYWNIAAGGENENKAQGGWATAQRGDGGRAVIASVRSLLQDSVRKHLIADVPVGVFLSSGIDSTAVAALASQEVSGVHTFTVDFPEAEFSEAAIARRTALRFGTNHRELMLSSGELLTRLGEAVGALDQPTMDGINTYFVSWAARQAGLKVALSGLGGDEVFGGYSTFRRTPQLQRIAAIGSRVPEGLRTAMAAAVSGAGGGLAPGDAARKIAALWNQPQSLPDPYFFSRTLFTPVQVSELMTKPVTNADSPWWSWLSAVAGQARMLDPFTAVTCMEARSYLVSTLLRDTDSTSMAHSLEVRVPFLDRSLVEFVTAVPEHLKTRKGQPKPLLVDAVRDLLPAEVVKQEKRGFTFPWASWLRGPLRRSLDQGFAELAPALKEALIKDNVAAVWKSYLGGNTSWSRPWSLYVLNEWAKRHL